MEQDPVKARPLPVSIELGAWGKPPTITLLDDWSISVNGVVYSVPQGFVSDGPSIPHYGGWRQLLSIMLNVLLAVFRFGKLRALPASVLHDCLYANANVPRRTADKAFRVVMKHDGVGLLGRWLAWAGVRLFGAQHYNNANRQEH